MDRHDLAKQLFGEKTDQGEIVGRTRTYFGTALADSADGRVLVSTDGVMVAEDGAQGIEVDCSSSIKSGQRVKITVVNGAPVDSTSIGWGDAMNGRLVAAENYFQTLFAENITAGTINAMAAYVNDVTAGTVTADQVDALRGTYEQLVAAGVSADELEAARAVIDKLEAGTVTASEIEAARAVFEELAVGTLSTEQVEAMRGVFEEVRAGTVSADELRAAQGYIEDLTARNITVQTLAADHADVGTLKTTKLDADLGNFSTLTANVAKVKELFGASGWFEQVSVEGGYVTGKLTAVLIDGDAAAIRNVKADSLTLLGDDGLYYALNVNALGQAEAERLPEEEQEALRSGIHGQNIIAGTITADKVTVTDLSAFGAMIAGMEMEGGSLHTVGKDALNSAAPGFFLDSDGNLSIGDESNYLTFYEGLDGKWHLKVSADEMTFGGNTPITDVEFANAIVRDGWEYAVSQSRTAIPSDGWDGEPPTLAPGDVLWRRAVTVRASGQVDHGAAECVTGNDGAAGEDATSVDIVSTAGTVFKSSSASTTLIAIVRHGADRIETQAQLVAAFGAGARIRWSYMRTVDNTWQYIPASDERLSDGGFRLAISGDDVSGTLALQADVYIP